MINYDKYNPGSIFDFSKKLLGKTLKEAIESTENMSVKQIDDLFHSCRTGKGSLGQLVEELFFKYKVNSNPNPDFEEAGLELKCTPLKKARDGQTLLIKERLVCGMIDYEHIILESFENSHFYNKCRLMLLLFYLHIKEIPVYDLQFIFALLWKLPEKDLKIIRHDYDIIVNKIKAGKAHELSEGDTFYLGACRKGQKGDKPVKQPYSDILAPKRAFSLKPAYMRTILELAKKSKDGTHTNTDYKPLSLVSEEDLKKNTFEEILLNRFQPFIGKTLKEISDLKKTKFNVKDKSRWANAAKIIATGLTDISRNPDNSEEFQKSGIRMKTIRLEKNGMPKESMSFENIDFYEVDECENFEDSRLFEIFTNRFFFVIYKKDDNKTENFYRNGIIETGPAYVLDKVFFWTMKNEDLVLAEKYWINIKENIKRKTTKIGINNFYTLKDKKYFHVRPKAQNKLDRTSTPYENETDKQCYWFNAEYVSKIIKEYSSFDFGNNNN